MPEVYKMIKKKCGKRGITRHEQFLHLPQFSKDLYCKILKARAYLVKGLITRKKN